MAVVGAVWLNETPAKIRVILKVFTVSLQKVARLLLAQLLVNLKHPYAAREIETVAAGWST